ncbi:thiamine phosphate synthase [Plantactinospora siamensis]|uniref:Thiamine-phosphate synthase n=1 Tax=Plantactinospora siamensis TaxID=555372 RepID=A0ABV6P466_9ACTN
MSPPLGRLHVLTDARAGRDALGVATRAVEAGAPVIQLRVKGRTDRELYDLGTRLMAICARHGTVCVVNDRPDLALAIGAHGTHLGADDLPVAAVRRLVGPGHLIGGTAREPGRAARLVAEGVDYLGVGPAYGTSTKAGLPTPIGPAGVGAVARAVDVPVIAIGGITADRVRPVLAAGAYGVAVVGAVSDAADPAAATGSLLDALGEA